jgi:arylsulfatase A-like enzyme
MEAFSDLRGGTRCGALVTLADLMPTLLAAAGLPRPNDLPAGSADLVEIHRASTPRNRFVGAYGDQYGLIDGDWKYLYTSDGGGELLFHLADDPQERHNLAPQHPDICRTMHGQLAEEVGRHGYAGLKTGARTLPLTPVGSHDPRQARWPGFHSRDHTPEDVLH